MIIPHVHTLQSISMEHITNCNLFSKCVFQLQLVWNNDYLLYNHLHFSPYFYLMRLFIWWFVSFILLGCILVRYSVIWIIMLLYARFSDARWWKLTYPSQNRIIHSPTHHYAFAFLSSLAYSANTVSIHNPELSTLVYSLCK